METKLMATLTYIVKAIAERELERPVTEEELEVFRASNPDGFVRLVRQALDERRQAA